MLIHASNLKSDEPKIEKHILFQRDLSQVCSCKGFADVSISFVYLFRFDAFFSKIDLAWLTVKDFYRLIAVSAVKLHRHEKHILKISDERKKINKYQDYLGTYDHLLTSFKFSVSSLSQRIISKTSIEVYCWEANRFWFLSVCFALTAAKIIRLAWYFVGMLVSYPNLTVEFLIKLGWFVWNIYNIFF